MAVLCIYYSTSTVRINGLISMKEITVRIIYSHLSVCAWSMSHMGNITESGKLLGPKVSFITVGTCSEWCTCMISQTGFCLQYLCNSDIVAAGYSGEIWTPYSCGYQHAYGSTPCSNVWQICTSTVKTLWLYFMWPVEDECLHMLFHQF